MSAGFLRRLQLSTLKLRLSGRCRTVVKRLADSRVRRFGTPRSSTQNEQINSEPDQNSELDQENDKTVSENGDPQTLTKTIEK
eukprot:6327924-Amphidinium_carterae.1